MPPQTVSSLIRREDGTASVEFVAVIPFLLLAVLVAAQLALVGQAQWSAGVASRAAARAVAVGREAEPAARRALPATLRRGAVVRDGDGVSVRVFVPRLMPWLPRLTVAAKTSLGPGDE